MGLPGNGAGRGGGAEPHSPTLWVQKPQEPHAMGAGTPHYECRNPKNPIQWVQNPKNPMLWVQNSTAPPYGCKNPKNPILWVQEPHAMSTEPHNPTLWVQEPPEPHTMGAGTPQPHAMGAAPPHRA